ncbi:MAG: L,D-transpeptidase [Nitrospirae bacterium]|nr:L,D-transpeptidase [Nitrospirota bacterium]
MRAEAQKDILWKAGAEIYAPEEYKGYLSSLKNGRDLLIAQNAKFGPFRDYESVTQEFRNIILRGELIKGIIEEKKGKLYFETAEKIDSLNSRVENIRKLSSMINEGRLSSHSLTKAEIYLGEARQLFGKELYNDAKKKIDIASRLVSVSVDALSPILKRYADEGQIAKWQGWVRETVNESKERGDYTIVISKIDKKLILYNGGVLYKTYEIGIGINGSKDKLYAGDRATPEGKYRIIKKVRNSRYHRALLIDYPNDEDRRQFVISKRKGIIPKYAQIGGLIEIHGGGKDGMTYGCVGMDNNHIDELFRIVEIGTPVVIVGAVDFKNHISSAIREL